MSVMLTAVPTGRADFASGVPTALKNAAGKDIPYGFVLTPHTLTARELTQEEREFFALAKSGRLLLSSDRACLCAVTPHALEIYLTGGELRRAGRIQTRGEILACDLTGERIYLALYDASAGTQIVSYDLRQTCGGRTVCCKKSVYKSRARISLLRSAWAYGGDRLVFIEDGVLQCGIVGETGGFSPAWTKAAANADTLLTAAAAGSVLAFESGSKTFESVIMADLVTGETQSFILNGVNAVRSFADRGYFYDGAVLSVMNRAQNEGFVYYINMPSWRRMFEVDAVFFTADGYHAIFLTADGVLKYGLMDLQGTFTLQAQTQYSGEPPVAAIAAADMLLLLRADGGASAFTLDGTGGTLFYGGAEDELQAVLTAYSAPPKPFVLKSIRVSAGA